MRKAFSFLLFACATASPLLHAEPALQAACESAGEQVTLTQKIDQLNAELKAKRSLRSALELSLKDLVNEIRSNERDLKALPKQRKTLEEKDRGCISTIGEAYCRKHSTLAAQLKETDEQEAALKETLQYERQALALHQSKKASARLEQLKREIDELDNKVIQARRDLKAQKDNHVTCSAAATQIDAFLNPNGAGSGANRAYAEQVKTISSGDLTLYPYARHEIGAHGAVVDEYGLSFHW